MAQPVFENISVNVKSERINHQLKAECKTSVLCTDVGGILSVTPWASVEKATVENGKIHYNGKIIYYVSYVDAQGQIRKNECGSEFSGQTENLNLLDDAKLYFLVNVEKVDTDTSGSVLTLSSIVNLTFNVTGEQKAQALVGGEGLIVKQQEFNHLKSLGLCKTAYPIEEEFEINYPVQEVLFHRAEGVITAVQSGVGCIIADGEVLFSAIMLQNTEKRDIIKETRTFPFRVEIECEQAMPNMLATARVKEKSFKIDVSVDEQTEKSTVGLSVTLLFTGEAFVNDSLSIATDCFCIENQVEAIKDNYYCHCPSDLVSFSGSISGVAQTNEFGVGSSVRAVCGEKATIISSKCQNQTLTVTGVANAVVYLSDGDGRAFTRKVEIPFEKEFKTGFDCDVIAECELKLFNSTAKILSLTEIELDADLYLTVYPSKKEACEVISQLKILAEKEIENCAISVYIPTVGEDLWSLAKRLNTCPEALVATNKDLQFPLTGRERIVIYRQK